jgi:hypothetical protein
VIWKMLSFAIWLTSVGSFVGVGMKESIREDVPYKIVLLIVFLQVRIEIFCFTTSKFTLFLLHETSSHILSLFLLRVLDRHERWRAYGKCELFC